MSVINEEDKLNLKFRGKANSQKIYNTYNLLHYIDELSVGKMYGIQRVTKDITILTKKEVVLKQKNEELQEKIKELEDENYVQKKIIFEDCIPKQELIDKIDELEQDIKEFEQIDNTGRFKRENCISFYKKEVLEELLENNYDMTKENKRINYIDLDKIEDFKELLENNFDITKENKSSADSVEKNTDPAEKSVEIEKLKEEISEDKQC